MRKIHAVAIAAALITFSIGTAFVLEKPTEEIGIHFMPPTAPALTYSVFRTGPFEVAKVFGRSAGCQDVTVEFVNDVALAAIHEDIDAKLVAAEVAVESSCNPLAISSVGAVGLMQIHVKTWGKRFDFSRVNLFDRKQNLAVGSRVLGDYVRTFGLKDGVRRYNGTGIGCETCDSQYASKVLTLVSGKQ